MLGEALATRFEFGTQTIEDKYGRHVTGKRLDNDLPVSLAVLDPQLKVGAPEAHGVVETARKLAAGKVPDVLLCLEAGRTEGGNIYLVSEAAGEDSLKTLIRQRNGLAPDQALIVAYRLAAILKGAETAGVNHLDLSSSNVFVRLDEGEVQIRIGRYGFANLLPTYNPARKNDAYHGTAEYMAPEVCAGRPGDGSADLYALGILMYEMVAGKPPFVSSSPSTTIKRQVYEKPLPLHLVKPGAGPLEEYETLVTSLLSKDPKQRPADAGEVMGAIAALKSGPFPGVTLDLPQDRESVPEISSLLEDELRPAPVPETDGGRATVAISGLAEALAASGVEGHSPMPVPTPEDRTSESRPTEAFDASFIAAAVEAAQRGESPMEAAQAAQVAQASLPESPEPAGVPEEAAPDTLDETKTSEEWFVDGSRLPDTAFPVADREDKKESRMFWVVAVAVAILFAIAAAVWLEGRTTRDDEDRVPITQEEPVRVVVPPPPPPPPPAPEPAPAAEPEPAPAPQPEPEPAVEPSPAQKAAALVIRARQESDEGRLGEAKESLELALQTEPGNRDARRLLATVETGIRRAQAAERAAAKAVEEPSRPRPAPAPRAQRPAPAPKPAAPAMSDAERGERVKALIRTGRDAYNAGDFKKAISNYNQALAVDPNNALVKKLLEQARAKVAE
jgi:tetratricopeptide (TPR) repeat protein